jgi:moderate conductance mechanosensitive channel
VSGYDLNLKAALIGALLLCVLGGMASAQTPPQGASPTAQAALPQGNSASEKPAERGSDLRALNRVLELLKNEEARTELIRDLERLRSGMAAQTEATRPAAGKNGGDEGLLGAVTKAVKTAGENAPEALAAPLSDKVDEAASEIQRELDDGLESGSIQHFLLVAAPGWLLALGFAFVVRAVPWVRRGRARLIETVRASDHAMAAARAIVARGLWALLPLLCGGAVIGVWPMISGMDDAGARVFLTFAIPILVAGALWQLTRVLLALLGPSRGWRRIGYAQRRLIPWISGLGAAASVSAILRSPFIWETLSADISDLVALAFDVGIGLGTIVFIAKYRLVVRSLIIRRHKATAEPKQVSPLWRVISILAKRWHILGILFVAAHIIARLLGGNVDFVASSLASLLVIVLGLMFALMVDARLANRAQRLERYGYGAVRRIRVRYLHIARIYAQGVLFVIVGLVCLDVWELDPAPWLRSEAGWSMVRPVLSILAALTAGWMLWVALDSFITNALSSVDRYGRARAHSSRTKTVLPLVRNVIFVALCVIILIAVLANIGINVAPLLAGAGIVGLAVGFGSQQLVQDLITGLFILFEGTIAVGDVIDTGDRAGTVEALTIRTVKIRDVDGALHSIPFSQIKALKNRSRDYGVYTVKATVGYGSDLDQAMDIMREIGDELSRDPKFSWDILTPLEIWGVDQFAPEGVVIIGVIKTRPLRQWSVGREFNLRLKKRFDEADIAMAVPRLSLVTPPAHVSDGDRARPAIEAPSAS